MTGKGLTTIFSSVGLKWFRPKNVQTSTKAKITDYMFRRIGERAEQHEIAYPKRGTLSRRARLDLLGKPFVAEFVGGFHSLEGGDEGCEMFEFGCFGWAQGRFLGQLDACGPK